MKCFSGTFGHGLGTSITLYPSIKAFTSSNFFSSIDVVIGYGYTIKTIQEHVKGKKIVEVTMQNQEDAYQEISKEGNHTILVPFTGDVNFSESGWVI